jgi:hypothetical protein
MKLFPLPFLFQILFWVFLKEELPKSQTKERITKIIDNTGSKLKTEIRPKSCTTCETVQQNGDKIQKKGFQ